jgi:hypothetical protein
MARPIDVERVAASSPAQSRAEIRTASSADRVRDMSWDTQGKQKIMTTVFE